MGSSDDVLKNTWAGSGGEKVTDWQDGKGIEGQIESGKGVDTNVSEWDKVKSDF
jgi:hypothetical protein